MERRYPSSAALAATYAGDELPVFAVSDPTSTIRPPGLSISGSSAVSSTALTVFATEVCVHALTSSCRSLP